MPVLDILCHYQKPPVPGMGVYLVESLAIGSLWKTPTILDYYQDYWLFSVNWCIKTLLLKTTLTYLIKHGEVKLVPN